MGISIKVCTHASQVDFYEIGHFEAKILRLN